MDSLIFISPFVNKFLTFFQYMFVSERKATQYNLLLPVLGIVVTSSLSMRKCFRHVSSRLSDKSLNSFLLFVVRRQNQPQRLVNTAHQTGSSMHSACIRRGSNTARR